MNYCEGCTSNKKLLSAQQNRTEQSREVSNVIIRRHVFEKKVNMLSKSLISNHNKLA